MVAFDIDIEFEKSQQLILATKMIFLDFWIKIMGTTIKTLDL